MSGRRMKKTKTPFPVQFWGERKGSSFYDPKKVGSFGVPRTMSRTAWKKYSPRLGEYVKYGRSVGNNENMQAYRRSKGDGTIRFLKEKVDTL